MSIRALRNRAFTLIEVMVALAIIALSLTAVAAKMGRMIDTSNSMQERTYASWIAQNKTGSGVSGPLTVRHSPWGAG